MLTLHFYRMNPRTTRLLRWFWRPRPAWTHCCVQWEHLIIDLSSQGFGVHYAIEHIEDFPPDLSLPAPNLVIDADTLGDLINRWEGTEVECGRAALWFCRLWRRHRPHTCASVVATILNLSDGHSHRFTGVTPDELYEEVLDAVADGYRIGPPSSSA